MGTKSDAPGVASAKLMCGNRAADPSRVPLGAILRGLGRSRRGRHRSIAGGIALMEGMARWSSSTWVGVGESPSSWRAAGGVDGTLAESALPGAIAVSESPSIASTSGRAGPRPGANPGDQRGWRRRGGLDDGPRRMQGKLALPSDVIAAMKRTGCTVRPRRKFMRDESAAAILGRLLSE